MSDADRIKWNDRYESGEYKGRTHPSELIQTWLPICEVGTALDLACGIGRNSAFLSREGFKVRGLDISEVALETARQSHTGPGVSLAFDAQDLDTFTIEGLYDLIVMVRYVNLSLLQQCCDHLKANGIIMVEEHLVLDNMEGVGGPRDPNFRVAPGVLREQLADLCILHEFQGRTNDPDGTPVALSQIVARKS